MSLYRIMLVDDEEEVRKAIIRKIAWEQLGFVMVGDAENGEDALEKLEQLEPDVVMTDIRMPYMDGLTLSARIRDKYPSLKILIFSGYDDFEYAKQAIKLNVTEYILKPVNGEELTQILNRIRISLDEEIEQRRNITALQKSYLGSLPILRELFLNDLVRRTTDIDTVVPKLREYGIDILDARKWLAVVIHIEQIEQSEIQVLSQHQELIPISVRGLVEDHLKSYCRNAIFNSADGITVIVAVDENNTQTGLINLLNDICKESKRVLEVSITVGVGHSCNSLKEISRSYQSAVDALGYRAIVGIGKTIYINDVEPVICGKLQLDVKSEAELTAAVKFGPKELISNVIQSLVAHMDEVKVHARQYQAYMLSIVNCITRTMQQYDLDIGEMFDSENWYTAIMEGIYRKEEFAEWLLPIALRMNEALNHERDNTARKVILNAKEYILEHYSDPELSVETLC